MDDSIPEKQLCENTQVKYFVILNFESRNSVWQKCVILVSPEILQNAEFWRTNAWEISTTPNGKTNPIFAKF